VKRALLEIGCAFAICLIMLTIVAVAVYWTALDEGEYLRNMDRLNVHESVGVPREEVHEVARGLVAHFRSGAPLENTEVTMFGERRPFYNEKELAHLADVSDLLWAVRWGICAAVVVASALTVARNRAKRREGWKHSGRTALFATTGFLALGGGFALWAALDFRAAFHLFHLVLFRNDLWLLDPSTDALIRMMPNAFFVAMAWVIVQRIALLAAVVAALWGSFVWIRRRGRAAR